MQIFTDKAVNELVADIAKLEAELAALRGIKDAAYGVVNGTDRDRPISLSTMSLMALFDALDAYDEAVKTPLS